MSDSNVTTFDADNTNPGGAAPMLSHAPSSSVTLPSLTKTVISFSVWDGDCAILEEYATNNVRTEAYVQGLHGLVKTLVANVYYYQDELGSTSHVANSSGALLESYRYDMYGKPSYWSSSGSQLSVSSYSVKDLFTGQRWIAELGLYDDRNRFMSPDQGRFLQPDPIGFKGDSSNLYRYCGNDWANRTDPMGLEDPVRTPTEANHGQGASAVIDRWLLAEQNTVAGERAAGALQVELVAKLAAHGEDSKSNLDKRARIDEIARSSDGSHTYDYGVKKDNFGVNSDKCAKFVSDVTKQAGAPILVKDRETGKLRSPTAEEIATQKIGEWRMLGRNEKAKPGDIAAYPIPGHREYTGHSGVMISDGKGGVTNISAHADGVYTRANQFEQNRLTVYQRYIGD